MNKKFKKIAILGTRGVPANYGGFETFAEELGSRLAARGHKVTVYCRKGNANYSAPEFKAMRLVFLPTIYHKYFETIAHTFISTLHVIFTDTEIVYYCNAINSVYAFLPRLFGKKTVINVDGLEWKRAKWSSIGKRAYQVAEWIATFSADAIISDSRRIELYYKRKFKKDTTFISYGASGRTKETTKDRLVDYGLKERGYLLYVSRLEPENNAHIMIEAYEKIETDMPLVIVGHAPYANLYVQKLRSTKDSRIKFLGGVYGENYQLLNSHAFLYLHGNEVGGTNPALLEAMAFGNCVIANGVGFNREVVGEAGLWFKPRNPVDLKAKIEYLLAHPEEADRYRALAPKRIKAYYSWDKVADQYEEFFEKLIAKEKK